MANDSHHNSGRAWHLDRQKHNKSEDWEQPMRSRKLRYKAKTKPQEKKFLGIFEDGGMPNTLVYIGKNKYKYKDFEFEVEEGELNMTSPEFYEGQEIYGSEPTLSEIKSVIADYFDFENRDMKNFC